jgi:hypothetical protein
MERIISKITASSIYLLIYTSLGRRANNRKAAQFSPNARGGKAVHKRDLPTSYH